jgi:hypothetical protein
MDWLMPQVAEPAEYWRRKAAELRERARAAGDDKLRRLQSEAATGLECLAVRAEQRLQFRLRTPTR